MNTLDSIPDTAWQFLLVRRGLPLAAGALSLLFAFVEPHGAGWFFLIAIAFFADAWPTFRTGDAYLRGRRLSIRRDGLWVQALRPMARWFGREEEWILSFCAWNNRRVRQAFRSHRAGKALVLLPHCIQMASCKANIISDLSHCFRCGKCAAGDVLEHSLAGRWHCRISNRSHKAYREAREFQPDLIVAVSCTDRLLKGLIKLPEVPSYVIPLQLPHGMCVDTTFNIAVLEAAVDELVEPKSVRTENIQPLQIEVGA